MDCRGSRIGDCRGSGIGDCRPEFETAAAVSAGRPAGPAWRRIHIPHVVRGPKESTTCHMWFAGKKNQRPPKSGPRSKGINHIPKVVPGHRKQPHTKSGPREGETTTQQWSLGRGNNAYHPKVVHGTGKQRTPKSGPREGETTPTQKWAPGTGINNTTDYLPGRSNQPYNILSSGPKESTIFHSCFQNNRKMESLRICLPGGQNLS